MFIFCGYNNKDCGSLIILDLIVFVLVRAGKKLKMSACGHFEASEMSSKVQDFVHFRRHFEASEMSSIINPNPQ